MSVTILLVVSLSRCFARSSVFAIEACNRKARTEGGRIFCSRVFHHHKNATTRRNLCLHKAENGQGRRAHVANKKVKKQRKLAKGQVFDFFTANKGNEAARRRRRDRSVSTGSLLGLVVVRLLGQSVGTQCALFIVVIIFRPPHLIFSSSGALLF